jgi:hypothetical protein
MTIRAGRASAAPALWASWALLAVAVVAAALTGCQDLRDYAGEWTGTISSDPALGHGFAPGTTINASVSAADREGIGLVVSWDGKTAPFVPIRRATGDALSEAQLPGEPLRTFFGFVQPAGDPPYLSVVSLFPENRLELRLIRGADEAYGVFTLRRSSRVR